MNKCDLCEKEAFCEYFLEEENGKKVNVFMAGLCVEHNTEENRDTIEKNAWGLKDR